MPSTPEAVSAFLARHRLLARQMRQCRGVILTSQLEMAQNAGMQAWTFEEVDAKPRNIMANIFSAAHDTAEEFGVPGNYGVPRRQYRGVPQGCRCDA